MSALVVPSGECLWSEGLAWLNGAVVCSLAAVAGPLFVSAFNGWPQRCSTIDSCRSTATSDDCKARLVRFRPCKTRYIRIPGFSFSFSTVFIAIM